MTIELSAVLVAVIVGLIEVLKRVGVNSKFAPIIAVIFGLGFSLSGYFIADVKLLEAIISGMVIGLSAVGLYSGTKNVKEGIIDKL